MKHQRRPKRRTAAEIIAFHFGAFIDDVWAHVYQPSHYSFPNVFAFDEEYYCSPRTGEHPPDGFGEWKEIGEHYGRKVYAAKGEQP